MLFLKVHLPVKFSVLLLFASSYTLLCFLGRVASAFPQDHVVPSSSNELPNNGHRTAANGSTAGLGVPDGGYFINLNTTNITGLDIVVEVAHNATYVNSDSSQSNTSNTDNSQVNPAELRREHIREGLKLQRLYEIQKHILHHVDRPNISSSAINEELRLHWETVLGRPVHRLQPILHHNEDVYAERLQSFYPSCSLPRNTDRDVWEDSNRFHVYYEIPTPRSLQGTSATISTAKLRLYKEHAVNSDLNGVLCPDSRDCDITEICRHKAEERFRITVYQYLRPLRRNKRARKRLVDSKMEYANYAGWVEFDVKASIHDWTENTNKNLGLDIVLEDALAVVHNPADYFKNMNCSEGRPSNSPFPRFMEDNSALADNESILFDNERYPTLDLKTVEIVDNESATARNEVSRRRRRHTTVCNANHSIKTQCCVQQFYVNFADIGWDDWVIQPQELWIGVCTNKCSNSFESNLSFSDFKSSSSSSNSPESCVPDETEALNLVLFDDETYEQKSVTLNNFIIKTCKCEVNHG